MSAYYIMSCIDGDECVLKYCETFADAKESLLEESQHDPHAQLSIWDSRGGMLVLWDCVHGNQYTLTGLATLAKVQS